MAVPNATITKNIALASDKWKRTAFPDGTLPNAGPSAPPEFTTSKTSSSITATITNANGATSFQVRVDSGTAVNGLTVSGLSANTSYSFQVRGVNEFGVSGWSTPPVSIQTDASGGGLTDPARLFTMTRGFEGTVGVKTSLESDGFDDIDGNSFYSNEQAATGSTSGKMTLLESDEEGLTPGEGGYGRWGGLINFPTRLQEGDEVFIRLRMYFPSGFIHYRLDNGTLIKWIRLRTEDSGGANQGYADLYWDTQDSNTTYRYIKEGIHVWYPFAPVSTYPHTFDQWETFNIHCIISSDPNVGKIRVWKGSDLLTDTSAEILNISSDLMSDFYLFTYWNGPVPQEQSCYVDDVVITSDRGQTQTHGPSGLPWIGV